MDKIAKMEIAKKGLIYIFVLIALIIVTYLVSSIYGFNPMLLSSINTLIPMVFVMVIFAVSIKYIVDMAIVKAEAERE